MFVYSSQKIFQILKEILIFYMLVLIPLSSTSKEDKIMGNVFTVLKILKIMSLRT